MNLADMTTEQLQKAFALPPYKARQLYTWIRRGVTDVQEMTDLSLSLREALKQHEIHWPKIYKTFTSHVDDTVKYLIELYDGNIIETVLMHYEHGFSLCISSQVGCRMGCAFCASTMDGLKRNLSPSEIEGQIRAVSSASGKRISNVVIMGIGEPLDNFDHVMAALSSINHPEGMGIGYRHITLSTCGLKEGLGRLMEKKLPITLALSLHAPNDAIRRQIMPAAKATTVKELVALMQRYAEVTGRRVTYEYALISGVNDSLSCAEELGRLLSGKLCHVNLIEVNPVEGRTFRRGGHKADFIRILAKYHVNATARRELGQDISASCGQLKKSVVRGEGQ